MPARAVTTCVLAAASAFCLAGVLELMAVRVAKRDVVDSVRRIATLRFGPSVERESPQARFGDSWTRAKLSRRSRFSATRREVETLSGSALGPERAAESLRAAFISDPRSDKATFSWGYATILADRAGSKVGSPYLLAFQNVRLLRYLKWFIAANDPGGDLDNARVRVLVETSLASRPDLVPICRKSFSLDTGDELVRRALATQLMYQARDSSLTEALRLCTDFLRQHPNDLSFINLVAATYELRWARLGHRRADGLETVKWARRYVALAPPASFEVPLQNHRIDSMLRHLAGGDKDH